MRLVKAVLVVVGVACGCRTDPPAAPPPMTAAECGLVRRTDDPRIVDVATDGTRTAGAACSSPLCLQGGSETWARVDESGIALTLGARVLTVPPRPGSRLSAFVSMTGVLAGNRVAAVDRGAVWELILADGSSTTILPPALAADERPVGISRVGNGITLAMRDTIGPTRVIELVPVGGTRPDETARPQRGHRGEVVWFTPGADATLRGPDGARVSLGAVSDRGAVVMFDDAMIVVDDSTIRVHATRGGAPIMLPPKTLTLRYEGGIVALGRDGSLTRIVVRDGALHEELGSTTSSSFDGTPRVGVVQKVTAASAPNRAALVIERATLPDCTAADCLWLMDVARGTFRRIDERDAPDRARMHPLFTGDRFRFVEADARYEEPRVTRSPPAAVE